MMATQASAIPFFQTIGNIHFSAFYRQARAKNSNFTLHPIVFASFFHTLSSFPSTFLQREKWKTKTKTTRRPEIRMKGPSSSFLQRHARKKQDKDFAHLRDENTTKSDDRILQLSILSLLGFYLVGYTVCMKDDKKRIAVFCGSSFGHSPLYKTSAYTLSLLLAKNGYDLVYGGGYLGIMGHIAEVMKDNGREVIGVLPEIFNKPKVRGKEVHTSLIITPGMHERKRKIYDLADAFIVFPGGIGTMDEFFESFTWKQIGIHKKPIILLNLAGFYDGIISYLNNAEKEGFISSAVCDSLIVASSVEEAMDKLQSAKELELPQKV